MGETIMFEKLIAYFDSYLTGGAPGYDLLIYQDGKPIFRHQNGYSDVENRIPVRGDERYNLYSCSKPITVSAALLLYEEGLFRLDDPLSAYLPEFARMTVREGDAAREARTPIRMRDLFCMTAGFTYNTASPALRRAKEETGGACPTRETMRYLAEEPLAFDPGMRWQYSLCHDVLAAAVEVIAGVPFGQFVKTRIFDPMGMTRSTFLLPDEELCEVSEQYCWENGEAKNIGKAITPFKLGYAYESGGAGCVSTADDYMRFLEGLRTGAILKPETVQLLATDFLDDNTRPYSWFNGKYGYGLGVRCPLADGREFTDFGWDGAAGSYMAIDPKHRLSVFYATHLHSAPICRTRWSIIQQVKEGL